MSPLASSMHQSGAIKADLPPALRYRLPAIARNSVTALSQMRGFR